MMMLLTLLSESNIVGQLYFIIGQHFPLRIIFVDISGSVTGCLKIFFELNFHIVKKNNIEARYHILTEQQSV